MTRWHQFPTSSQAAFRSQERRAESGGGGWYSRPRTHSEDDELAPAKGIAWGLALSIPLWIVILLIVGMAAR